NTVVQNDPAMGVEPETVVDGSAMPTYRMPRFDQNQLNPAAEFFNLDGMNVGRLGGGSTTDLLNIYAAQPIDELVATHSAEAQLSGRTGHANADGFDWPLLVRAAISPLEKSSESGPALTGDQRPIPEFAVPFERAGELVGELTTLSNALRLCEVASEFTDG